MRITKNVLEFAVIVLVALLLVMLAIFIWPGSQIRSAILAPAPTATAFQPPTATANVPPTVQPSAMAQATAQMEWISYEPEGGIPYNRTTWSADIAPDEIEVLTGGPACIASICLPGGIERGSVIILLPGAEVIHYEVTGLIPGSNWHGAYRPVGNPSTETTWRSLANNRVSAMQQAPNCTPGKGCKVIDILVIGPDNKVVAQWTVGL